MTGSREKDKICLVDDEEQITAGLALSLADDYEVHCFNSAEEALVNLERSEAPKVIVSDLKMPGIDGFGFMERLRKKNKTSKLILASGYAHKHDAIRALELGVFALLEKPFTAEQLMALLVRARESFAQEQRTSFFLQKASKMVRSYSELNEQYFKRIVMLEESIFQRELQLFTNPQDILSYQRGVAQERFLLAEIEALRKSEFFSDDHLNALSNRVLNGRVS